MLGRKVIYVRCISCSYNNVAKGIRLLDKKSNSCLYRKIFMQVKAFERYIPLTYLILFYLNFRHFPDPHLADQFGETYDTSYLEELKQRSALCVWSPSLRYGTRYVLQS